MSTKRQRQGRTNHLVIPEKVQETLNLIKQLEGDSGVDIIIYLYSQQLIQLRGAITRVRAVSDAITSITSEHGSRLNGDSLRYFNQLATDINDLANVGVGLASEAETLTKYLSDPDKVKEIISTLMDDLETKKGDLTDDSESVEVLATKGRRKAQCKGRRSEGCTE